MFEIGDRVRIKTKEEIMNLPTTNVSFFTGNMFIELDDDNTLSFVGDMEITHDLIGIVTHCTTDVCYEVEIKCPISNWEYHESWLEKVEEN